MPHSHSFGLIISEDERADPLWLFSPEVFEVFFGAMSDIVAHVRPLPPINEYQHPVDLPS